MDARPIQAGRYTKRLEVQRLEPFPRPGHDTPLHATIGHRWASLEPESGAESWVAQAPQEERMHVARHRYYPGLSSKDRYRVKIAGAWRIFEIVHVANPGEDAGTTEMIVRCKEQIPAPVEE